MGMMRIKSSEAKAQGRAWMNTSNRGMKTDPITMIHSSSWGEPGDGGACREREWNGRVPAARAAGLQSLPILAAMEGLDGRAPRSVAKRRRGIRGFCECRHT